MTAAHESSSEAAAPVEVEWQFDALDLRPVERFVAGGSVAMAGGAPGASGATTVELVPLAVQQLADTYVDTEDWRIGRSGLVLRIRKKRTKLEATIKDTKPAVEGLRKRLEISEPLPRGALVATVDGGPVSRCVWSLAGERPLATIFSINTRRRPFEVRVDGELVGELAIDETTIDVGRGESPVRLRRVEVEIDGAAEAMAAGFVEKLRRECGLQPATLSKFEAGLLAIGVEIPSGQDFGPTALPAMPTVGDVAYVAVRKALTTMVTREPGTRLGSDPEELHQMRVATRHMRAVLGIFAAAFPVRAQHLRAEIGWIAEVLGHVRDLDVQLEQLEGWVADARPADAEALAQLGTLLREHWAEARVELLQALDSPRYERLVSALAALLRTGPSSRLAGARAPAPEVVDAIVELQRKAGKAAKRAGISHLPADYHQLRIRCKRLRYALEYVSEVFEGRVAAYRKHIVSLQTILGNLQDAEVASTRLRSMAGADAPGASVGGDLGPAAIFVMGQLAERYDEMARRILEQIPHELGLVKGSDWRELHAFMEERRTSSRAAAEPPAPQLARRLPPRRASSPAGGSAGAPPRPAARSTATRPAATRSTSTTGAPARRPSTRTSATAAGRSTRAGQPTRPRRAGPPVSQAPAAPAAPTNARRRTT